jgi:MFS family permease
MMLAVDPEATPVAGTASRRPAGGVRRLLAGSGFRRLLAVRLAGQAGDGLLQAGLASFVLLSPEREPSPGRVAGSLALLLLPYSVVGPFAGALIDRWRRRQVLLVADLARAALSISLAGLVASSSTGVVFTCVALATVGVNRFILAALPAAQPHVVEVRDLVTSNALAPTLGSAATVLGGLAGVGLREALGGSDPAAAVIVLSAAALYVLAGGLCLLIASSSLGPDGTVPRPDVSPLGTARALVDAGRRIIARRAVVRALVALTSVRAAFGAWTVITIVRERTELHATTDSDAALAALGFAAVVGALGAVLAAFATPVVVRRRGPRTWVITLLGLGLLTLVVVLPIVSAWAVFTLAGVLGFVSQGVKVCTDTVLQRQVGDAWRGRAFSINDLLTNAAFVIAGILAVPFT